VRHSDGHWTVSEVTINKSDKKLSYRGDSARRRSLRCPESFKVTDFVTSRKPVCDFLDFLFVDNAKRHSVSHRFPVAQYWSHYRFRHGGASLYLYSCATRVVNIVSVTTFSSWIAVITFDTVVTKVVKLFFKIHCVPPQNVRLFIFQITPSKINRF